jgi:hypothetical protein
MHKRHIALSVALQNTIVLRLNALLNADVTTPMTPREMAYCLTLLAISRKRGNLD